MFRHILVPTDLTERSVKAMEIAVEMAAHDASKVTLLHVIETIEDAEDEDFAGFYRKLEKRAEKFMSGIIRQYQDRNPAIGKEIVYGRRVADILKFAGERGVDLIVLSSHRIERDNMLQGWGTISYKVGLLADCPVMLVK